MDPNIKMTELEPDGGCKIHHVNFKIPGMASLVFSNRSFYISTYEEELADGHLTLETTNGNDHIAAANTQRTGKDVLGTITVEYTKIIPCKSGVYFIKVK